MEGSKTLKDWDNNPQMRRIPRGNATLVDEAIFDKALAQCHCDAENQAIRVRNGNACCRRTLGAKLLARTTNSIRTMRHFLFSIIFVMLSLTDLSFAQRRPPVPFIEKGVCPFECCQFGRWYAKSSLRAYEAEGDTSTLAFVIAVHDSFLAITGNVHMDKPGTVVVTKSVGSFEPGDTLYTLSYRGEGFVDVWRDSTIADVEVFWDCNDETDFTRIDPQDPRWSEYSGVLVSKPLMIWWVQVQNPKGQTGWIRLVNTTIEGFSTDEQIEGADACE